jgi:hypothetical protein
MLVSLRRSRSCTGGEQRFGGAEDVLDHPALAVAEDAAGLMSKRRGRPSNRRKPAAVRAKALAIIGEQYWDFGPILAAEKLREVHRIALGRERLGMVEAGLWLDRKPPCSGLARGREGIPVGRTTHAPIYPPGSRRSSN